MTELQRQMLVMLVLDHGYGDDDRPLYGWAPMRHQEAWRLATEGIEPGEVRDVVREIKALHPEDAASALERRNLREAGARGQAETVLSVGDTMRVSVPLLAQIHKEEHTSLCRLVRIAVESDGSKTMTLERVGPAEVSL